MCAIRVTTHVIQQLQLERQTMAARILLAMLVMCCGTSVLRATECETAIARHMIGQALLAAHLVALVEKARMAPSEINAILKSISERPAQQESGSPIPRAMLI